ncbi:MAG: tRNA (adenosine(37)-N6)-threonylcarbamoyltransferase complex ATPase subunit type 1 TsaE [Patescibacteria group bacterium]|nr:tRNA (adenosine(37)-N6)-threonylcarbamoyltransferase complex ATPase subunit type 1 TsaE [Patescibacteria group bacterium]
MQDFISKSREQTQKIATDFAKKLKGGEVLCFYGNLGSGKTTFIQALAKALGVKENVTSPTFVLMKRYSRRGGVTPPEWKTGRGNRAPTNAKTFFYHMDAYRLNSSQEALDLGLEEIWGDKNNIIAIEWADKIVDILPEKKIDLCFACPEQSRGENLSENERKINIFN